MISREFDDNSSLLGHDTMQTGIRLSAFCSRLMSPSSETKSKKTLICQSKQYYIPKGLNLQQHRCQNQKFCRDFINRGKHCDVYWSSGIVTILIMETRWAEHVAWMEKRSSHKILGRKHLKDATRKLGRYAWLTALRLSGKRLRKTEMRGKRY
jgi:hypothetical protein